MRLVDRDVKLGPTQSCQRHKGHQNGGKAVGGLLTLSSVIDDDYPDVERE